jgi:hypothetical protein
MPTCPICIDKVKTPYPLACKHSFCGGCLDTWKENHDSCPLCRQPLKIVKHRTTRSNSFRDTIQTLQQKLLECERIQGRENRIHIVNEIFGIVSDNRAFLSKHKKFADTVKLKLIQLSADDDFVFYSSYWMNKLNLNV